MGWEARTNFAELEVHTRLCILERMQIGGQPPAQLIGNHDLPIELNGRWVQARILNANGRQATLELPDGRAFEISIRQADEFDSGMRHPGMHSEDWILRKQIT